MTSDDNNEFTRSLREKDFSRAFQVMKKNPMMNPILFSDAVDILNNFVKNIVANE
jgi:hypothetical protein